MRNRGHIKWSFKHGHLSTLRELLGLSPEDVGKKIGRPGMTVRNWEKGGYPKINDIIRIANEFDVDPRSFFSKNKDAKEPAQINA